MKRIALFSLISVLMLSLILGRYFALIVDANPIPVPTLIMPKEYINATISVDEWGRVYAEVNGLYPFHNLGYENVTMYYPVPPGSSEISVTMNETSLEWIYSDKNYSTVIGEFPMIKWFIEPLPDSFEIKTHYSHLLPKDGSYSFLYAMGTGRYLGTYAKETTAYVSISISKEIAPASRSIDIYMIGYDHETGKWLWKPANYTIAQDNDTWLISITEVSKPFHPLVEDLLVTIASGGSASGVNDGLELSMKIDKTTIVIGDVVNITLTLRNIGNNSLTIWFGSLQSFDICLYYMDIPIATWSDGKVFALYVWELYLEPNETYTETLEWNFFQYDAGTGGFTPPRPSMYPDDIVGFCVGKFLEMQPAVTTGKISIELTLPDINHDGRVNIIDIAIVARAYGSKLGYKNWNPIADLNDDEIINIIDISISALSYGKAY